jgi:deoxyribodipyrimidine photo-lyase
MNPTRIRRFNSHEYAGGGHPVLYWMGREHRVHDNWSLIAAQEMARDNAVPLVVVFTLVPVYLGATIRQYGFMLRGLKDVEQGLQKLDIPFYLLMGDPQTLILECVKKWDIGAIFADFLPLKMPRHWKTRVAEQVSVPMFEVDAHNVVPAWEASPKQEAGAYTIRHKLRKLWPTYLEEFSDVERQSAPWPHDCKAIDWDAARASLRVNMDVPEVKWAIGGEVAAQAAMEEFLTHRLRGYAAQRNIPGRPGQSDLSPYLHFGHLAPQRLALEVPKSNGTDDDKAAFLDELLVRLELTDNYCLYNEQYDTLSGATDWPRKTLDDHRADPRPFDYTREQLENAATHDDLWNAAQREMVYRGKMHGYMRMYWSKKILEWTAAPEDALAHAIYLNDKYFLDGRDPNGYANILWSIAGLHDRPWMERAIFGKVRYMNRNGCERKFDVQAYIDYVDNLP